MEVHWNYALGAVVVIVMLIIFCKRLHTDNARLTLAADAHQGGRAADAGDADGEAGERDAADVSAEGEANAGSGPGKRKKVRFA